MTSEAVPDIASAAEAQPQADHRIYRWHVLAVLTLTYACAYVDRNVMLALVEPIKQELALSDTQMGLLSGIAFSARFVLAGIPMGMLIDRVNRRNLLIGQVSVWSAMTALGGAASGLAGCYLFAGRDLKVCLGRMAEG
jgi:sugar phosphate permease